MVSSKTKLSLKHVTIHTASNVKKYIGTLQELIVRPITVDKEALRILADSLRSDRCNIEHVTLDFRYATSGDALDYLDIWVYHLPETLKSIYITNGYYFINHGYHKFENYNPDLKFFNLKQITMPVYTILNMIRQIKDIPEAENLNILISRKDDNKCFINSIYESLKDKQNILVDIKVVL